MNPWTAGLGVLVLTGAIFGHAMQGDGTGRPAEASQAARSEAIEPSLKTTDVSLKVAQKSAPQHRLAARFSGEFER